MASGVVVKTVTAKIPAAWRVSLNGFVTPRGALVGNMWPWLPRLNALAMGELEERFDKSGDCVTSLKMFRLFV